MSTSSLPPKRPHSRSPESSRRVRQRTQKRSESPEEGEVEDGLILEEEHQDHNDPAKSPEITQEEPKVKPKVAFPFKSRIGAINALPKVDLVNGQSISKRRTPSPPPGRSIEGPSLASRMSDVYRPSERYHGHDERRGRGESYVPARDRDRPDRKWHRVGNGTPPPAGWDAYIAEPYRTNRPAPPNGRPHDTFDPPSSSPGARRREMGGSPDGRPHRSQSPPLPKAEYHRPRSPPVDGPPERGVYTRRGSLSSDPYGLPPRPRSPRYYASRYDDPREDRYRGRSYEPRSPPRHDYGPPRPMSPLGPPSLPVSAPPPLPATDARGMYPLNDYYAGPKPPSQQGPPPRAMHALPPRPEFGPPIPNGMPPHHNGPPPYPPQPPYPQAPSQPPPPPARQPAVYSRPPNTQPVGQDHGPKNIDASKQGGQPEKQHKVATVRSKEDEKAAYGREFKGSGRISEYILMRKLGEGTFGEVHHARPRDQSKSPRDLALKRIIMHQEKDGMPITALREIKILKALDHPNIVKVLDIVVMPRTPKDAGSVYMVFPYMDHDLAGLLENPSVKLSQSHVKLYMRQLLEGLEYMHDNHIIHRDIKAANILVSNDGVLQIADFGLARTYIKNGKRERMERGLEKYTNCVVTRWYRPPELLMGERYYGAEIDIWGVGCILAEMFIRRPIFQGTSDMDQLEKIWWLCGTPTDETWPDFKNLPGLDGVKDFKYRVKGLREFLGRFDSITRETTDLIELLLSLDPTKRPTASDALLHEYFWTTPLPADPKTLPRFESSHELDRRRKDLPPAPPPNAHQNQYHGHHGPPYQNGWSHSRGRGGPSQGLYPGRGGPPGMQGPPQHYPPQGRIPGPGPTPVAAGPHGLPPPPVPPPYPPQYGPGPPTMNGPPPQSNGLPPPRGFRPPPRQHQQPPPQPYGQQPYPPGLPPRPSGGPIGMPPGPPVGRGPPPPPNDGMVLHYG